MMIPKIIKSDKAYKAALVYIESLMDAAAGSSEDEVEYLIAAKQNAGRPQDLAALDELRRSEEA